MSVDDSKCDFCQKLSASDLSKHFLDEEDAEFKLWCGKCSSGRAKYYERYVPLTDGFMKAVIVCDSHDLKIGNYENGWERQRYLDRIYDFSQILRARGVKEFPNDCDCGECDGV